MPDYPGARIAATEQADFKMAFKWDSDAIASILSAAFHDDPIMLWTFGSSEGVARAMRIFFLSIYVSNGIVLIDKKARAVSMWLLPGRRRDLPPLSALRYATALAPVGGLSAICRGARLAEALKKSRSRRPTLYLFALGVRPETQHRGLGSRMIASGLRVASELGVAVELETSKGANIGYYERHGFRVCSEITAAEGAPTVWSMQAFPR